MTDNEITAQMLAAAGDVNRSGHDPARRIVARQHFRVVYQRHPEDVKVNPEAGTVIFEAAQGEFGSENVRHDRYVQKGGSLDFPVLTRDGRIVSSLALSQALAQVPLVSVDFVFAKPEIRAEIERWISQHRAAVIQPREEEG